MNGTIRQIRRGARLLVAAVMLFPLTGLPAQAEQDDLRPVSDFAAIADSTARAQAIFVEITRVLHHPRCLNCHTLTDRPFQGEDGHAHIPRVTRGESGFGVPGMYCNSCHRPANYHGMPGNPTWVMAPASMGWTGFSAAEICLQLKDRSRNGDRSLEDIHHHVMEDHLLAYSWNPPAHLESAPGSRDSLGALFRAWIDAGAACPPMEDE